MRAVSAPLAASASTVSLGVGVSGSPIPRLITSTPAAFFAATLRSSSANRYGGSRSSRSLDLTETSPISSSLSSPRYTGTAQPVRSTCRSSSTSTSARRRRGGPSPGSSTPRSTAATAAPVAPVPEDIVSPTPRSKIRARIAAVPLAPPEGHVGAVGEQLVASIGARGAPGRVLEPAVQLDRALRVAHLHELEGELAAGRRSCRRRPRPRGDRLGAQLRPAHVDVQAVGPLIRGRIAPAAVRTEKRSWSTQPCGAGTARPRARRCRTARPPSRPG